ncbi:MAG: MBL fold metallo-hydrolase, partial [Bryobacteraceae bacterium]
MHNTIVLALTLALAASAQNAKVVLEAASKNIGAPRSVQYTGSGAQFTLGQNIGPAAPWPRVEVKSFTQTIDYEKTAARTEPVGPQGPAPVQFSSGDRAWGVAGGNVTPAAPAVARLRQMQIWATPHGFLRGALAHNATLKRKGRTSLVTFTAGKSRYVGTLSNDTVESVESWIDNPVLGDMHVVTRYSDYRDFGGFKFPGKIVQSGGGFPLLDFTITAAKADVPVDIPVPAAVMSATPPAIKVAAEKLGEGAWYLTGGSHHSVAVEFADHL